ncbi:alpha-galactosidase, partial [Streptomyces sp. MCAF7]
MTSAPQTLRWGHSALEVEIGVDDDGTARLTRIGLPGGKPLERRSWRPLPLVEVTAAGHGRAWSGGRLIDTTLGGRLRYRAHRATRDGDWHVLTVELHDSETGLVAEVVYRSPDAVPVLRGGVVLRNEGQATLHLESVSSLVVG